MIAVGVAAVLATAGVAVAHATLIGTNPDDGAKLETEPAEVAFEFNQNLGSPAYVVVKDPNGSRIDTGKAEIVDDTVTQAVESSGLAGEYSASYRVISADGHPVDGTITYHVSEGKSPDNANTGGDEDSSSDVASFVSANKTPIIVATAAVVIAGGLLLWPRKKGQ